MRRGPLLACLSALSLGLLPAAAGPPAGSSPRERHAPVTVLRVDARKHCLYLNRPQQPDESIATVPLQADRAYTVSATGQAWLSDEQGHDADPMPGVVLFYCSQAQDGYATQYVVLRSGETLKFHSPGGKPEHRFLSAFFLDDWPESGNRGAYELSVVAHPPAEDPIPPPQEVALHITFAHDPGPGHYDGVLGRPTDVWNLVEVGTREVADLRLADGSHTDVVAEISENDGEWGIEDQSGVMHGYIYHNCRCVDLSVTLTYLPPGVYEVYVLAHGDAPDQNAAIEIESAGVTYAGKSTLNDGTWRFRDAERTDGNQYVRYVVDVPVGSPLVIHSRRDGSSYAMLNAIQLRRLLAAE